MTKNNLGFHCHSLAGIDINIATNGLSRGEFYNFPTKDVASLKKEIIARDLARSVHSPLVKPDWYPNPPTWSFLCDVDKDSRNRTFKMINETIAQADAAVPE